MRKSHEITSRIQMWSDKKLIYEDIIEFYRHAKILSTVKCFIL